MSSSPTRTGSGESDFVIARSAPSDSILKAKASLRPAFAN